jgi:hypothetical protein
MDAKKDILAEIDLPGLIDKRAEAAKTQKESAANLEAAKVGYLFFFWLGGGAMGIVAVWLTPVPENDPSAMFWFAACVIIALGMALAAFFPAGAVRRLQDKANAAARQVRELDVKIEFCHHVLEEAKKVKVRRYAEALVEKQTS